MLGIAGDSVMLAVAVVVLGLMAYKFWYPPVYRWFRDVQEDIEDTNSALDKQRRPRV